MKTLLFSIILLFLTSCKSPDGTTTSTSAIGICRGEWSTKDSNGDLKKHKEYYHGGLKACVTEPVALTQWEKSSETRRKNNIQCTPQPQFPSVYLKATNNYYQYRDGKILLELDSTTGQFRRLITGFLRNGTPTFVREIGCFYQRTDHETEPVNPKDHGDQILLDLELAASSKVLTPIEVYRYQNNVGNWEMTRFDDNTDVDWMFCNPNDLPWEYCLENRNGNDMYFPDNLSQTTMDKLKNEAVLIRSEYNFIQINKSEFDSTWTNQLTSSTESDGANWLYGVIGIPDVPRYTDRAWRDYLMGNRPAMPDIDSPKILPVCYQARRKVTLNNGGTATINGEVCYIDGEYVFTEN